MQLQRYGQTAGTLIDNITYGYQNGEISNRLAYVNDAEDETIGFKEVSNTSLEYDYDFNGNMIADDNKGIGSIVYNYLNLPQSITKGAQSISYGYDATGRKLRNTVDGAVTEYIGNFIYQDDTLMYILTSEGRVLVGSGSYKYEYNLTDHLGNVRVSFSDDNGDGSILATSEIKQVSDYYPFGMLQENIDNRGDATQDYLYNGKELQEELDWYDYGARMYDAALGRFTTIDPWAEKFNFQSPYLYAYNNPIRFTDYMGMGGEDEVKKEELEAAAAEGKTVQESTENVVEVFEEGDYVSGETFADYAGISGEGGKGEETEISDEQKEAINSIDKVEKTDEGFQVKLKEGVDDVEVQVPVMSLNEETGKYETAMTLDLKVENNATISVEKSKDGGLKLGFDGVKVGKGFAKIGMPSVTLKDNSAKIMGVTIQLQ
jgi:RHS repeat-associated protein